MSLLGLLQPDPFHHDQDVTAQFDQTTISLVIATHLSVEQDHQLQY